MPEVWPETIHINFLGWNWVSLVNSVHEERNNLQNLHVLCRPAMNVQYVASTATESSSKKKP